MQFSIKQYVKCMNYTAKKFKLHKNMYIDI